MNLPEAQAIKRPSRCRSSAPAASRRRRSSPSAIERGRLRRGQHRAAAVANNDLVEMFGAASDRADRPCTYCNNCLVNVVENPLGCYEEIAATRRARRWWPRSCRSSIRRPSCDVLIATAARLRGRERIKTLVVAIVLHRAAAVVFVSGSSAHAGRATVRSSTRTSPSTSSTARSAASRAARSLRPIGGVLPPYWVFKTLPSICSDKLPGGYASLGLIFEPGHDLPIGVSRRRRLRRRSGRVQLRALPHRAPCASRRARRAAHHPRHAGAAARSAGARAVRPRLLARQPDDGARTSADGSKRRAARAACSSASCSASGWSIASSCRRSSCGTGSRPILGRRVPGWGRGRVDTFNPYKAIQFNWPLDQLPTSELIGAVGLSRRSGTRRRARACSCTGTATTIRSTSAT